MPRRKETEELIEVIEPESGEAAAERRRKRKPSIHVPLRPDGRADWEALDEERKKKLVEALSEVARFGGSDEGLESQAVTAGALVPVVPALYRVLGGLEGLLAAWLAKVDREKAFKVMEYTDEEIQVLTVPTAAVLAKHAGAIAEYQAEVTLALHLAAIHQAKIAKLMEVKDEHQEALAARRNRLLDSQE